MDKIARTHSMLNVGCREVQKREERMKGSKKGAGGAGMTDKQAASKRSISWANFASVVGE